jgi:hypothetical protein
MDISLLECLTLKPPAELTDRLASLPDQQWRILVDQAIYFAMEPLLWRRLAQLGFIAGLPDDAKTSLQARVHYHGARNLAMYHELGAVLDRLSAQAIPVMALKGVYLAKTVYPGPRLRPMSDMDLLVKKADLDRVQTILLEMGYGPKDRPPVEAVCEKRAELDLFCRSGATPIDVHWHIERPTAPFAIDLEEMWGRAQPWRCEDRWLWAPAPEDLLLQLGLHSVYHHHCRVSPNALLDIAQAIEHHRDALDWSRFSERAHRWGATRPVCLALMLARDLAGAEIPEAVIEALDPENRASAWLVQAKTELLTERRGLNAERPMTAQDRVDGFVTMMHQLDVFKQSRSARMQHFWQRLFPPRDILQRRYPRFGHSRWIFLMYGVHWSIVAGRYGYLLATRRRHWVQRRRLHRWLQSQ